MHYLYAYDIADPRRLQRVARRMERRALRVQKSVFLFRGDAFAAEALLNEVAPLLNLQEDVVQAWKLTPEQPLQGLIRGSPLNVFPAGVILGSAPALYIESPAS